MARSRLNIVLHPTGLRAAKEMQERLQIPFIQLDISYDPDEILATYERLAEALSTELSQDLSWRYKQAKGRLREAAQRLQDVAVVLDASATMRPFSLAHTLLDYGFNVTEIMADGPASDARGLALLQKDYPHLRYSSPQHHGTVLFDRRQPDVLAIGFDAGYITGAHHVVGLVNDEGMFGFWAVERLMEMVLEAWTAPTDLENMIASYGLVV